MTALVCDICGGKLAMGPGGIAVCDSCGMEHTKDRMQEKIQEIKGVVKVDNSDMVENYLIMAENAYEADNKSEAEIYCNKIIEITPSFYKAWLLKGKAVGWQSTLAKIRFTECANCFAKAIELAPENEIESITEEVTEDMKRLAIALISLRSNLFENYPNEEVADGFSNDISTIQNAVVHLFSKSGVLVSGFMEALATGINEAVVAAWGNKILPDYNGTENRPNEFEWREFINRIGCCTMLVEKAIDLSHEDDEDDILRYENLIFLHEQAIDSCSWDYEFNDWGNKSWHVTYFLADTAKKIRRELITDYQNKIKKIKNAKAVAELAEKAEKERMAKEEASRRNDEYWAEHMAEKLKLEADIKDLTIEIVSLKNEIEALPENAEKAKIQECINKLTAEKNALGLFKVKEKKVIQEQINTATSNLNAILDKLKKDTDVIQSKINTLQAKLNNINSELSKAR